MNKKFSATLREAEKIQGDLNKKLDGISRLFSRMDGLDDLDGVVGRSKSGICIIDCSVVQVIFTSFHTPFTEDMCNPRTEYIIVLRGDIIINDETYSRGDIVVAHDNTNHTISSTSKDGAEFISIFLPTEN